MLFKELFEETSDGDKYFEESVIADITRIARNPKSSETIISISPEEFLKLAANGTDRSKEATVDDVIDSGQKFNSHMFLKFEHDGKGTAKVFGHEGRHRARKLIELGVKKVTIVFWSISGDGAKIRWGSQDNKFDAIKYWPEKLVSEDGDYTTEFPTSLIYDAPDPLPKELPPEPKEEPADDSADDSYSVDDFNAADDLLGSILKDFE